MAAIFVQVFVVFCVLTSLGQAEFFSFTQPGDSSPSIILEADFSITIKAFKSSKEVGSYVIQSSDSNHVNLFGAVGPMSFLYLRFSHSVSWAFVFDAYDPEHISLDRLLQFVPTQIFPGICDLDDSLEFTDPGETDLGSSQKSHICKHESMIEYLPKYKVRDDIHFTVHVQIQNFHVQALNVKGGEFSEAHHCDADFTTPSTTRPTDPIAKTSKSGMETEKTTDPVTSITIIPADPPSLGTTDFFSFTPYGEKFPAIILQADFTITIKAFKGKTEIGSVTKRSSKHEEVTVEGVTGPRSFLYLRFPEGINWVFLFNTIDSKDVTLKRLIQIIPNKLFPNISTIVDSFNYEHPGTTDIGSPHNSYACSRESTVSYHPKNIDPSDTNFTVSVKLRDFRVQAFNVKDGKFSPAKHCGSDFTTTPSTASTTAQTSTPTPTTTTAPKEITTTNTKSSTTTTFGPTTSTPTTFPTNSYIIRNSKTGKVCISAMGKIKFDIHYDAQLPYQTTTTDLISRLGIPKDYTLTGECSPTASQQSFTIFFFRDWYIEFEFELYTSTLLLQSAYLTQNEKLDYGISNITLSYVIDHEKFPYSVEKDGTRHTVSVSKKDVHHLPRKKRGQDYYRCDAKKKVNMGKNVDLSSLDVKFKAFSQDDDGDFKGSPTECDEDNKKKEFDWPVVGYILLAFFLLILLIIIVFLIIRRRRKRKGYRNI